MNNEVQLIPEYAEIKFITEHEGTEGQLCWVHSVIRHVFTKIYYLYADFIAIHFLL